MHWEKICIRTYTLPSLLVDVQQQHKHNQLLLSVSILYKIAHWIVATFLPSPQWKRSRLLGNFRH